MSTTEAPMEKAEKVERGENEPWKVKGWAVKDSKAEIVPYEFTRRPTGNLDVVIKVKFVGICHSDIHMAKNQWNKSVYPMVPGQEIAGEVIEVGKEVLKFNIGDNVGVGGIVGSCLTCDFCLNNRENYCQKLIRTYNSLDTDGTMTYGGYCNIMVVNERFVVSIPNVIPLDCAAPLMCAGLAVYSPIRVHGFDRPGLNIGICGLGGLGHMAVKFLKAMGVTVTAISSSPMKRQEAAQQLNLDGFINSRSPDSMQKAANTLDGIIDTLPMQHSLLQLLTLLKPNGKVVMLGCPQKSLALPVLSLVTGGKSICGSNLGGMQEMQDMLDFAAHHNIRPEVEGVPADSIGSSYSRIECTDCYYRFVLEMDDPYSNGYYNYDEEENNENNEGGENNENNGGGENSGNNEGGENSGNTDDKKENDAKE